MRKNTINQHIEILPAPLLSHKEQWQAVARSLPAGACLLVTNLKNQKQTQFMLELARWFREMGREVIIWAVGQRGVQ